MRLPPGSMCTYYLGRALQECLAAVNAQDYQKVCDLDRGWRTMILLGSALTSFAMLGFKLAHIQVVRMQFSEQQRMEREREELIAELEQTVSADVAGKYMDDRPMMMAVDAIDWHTVVEGVPKEIMDKIMLNQVKPP